MQCKICGNTFYIKRSFVELFSQKKEYVCDKCHKLVNIKFEMIELEKYQCLLISMFNRRIKYDYNFFINDYNVIFKRYFCNNKYHILFLDYVCLSDFGLEILNIISKLVKNDLIIITFYVKK